MHSSLSSKVVTVTGESATIRDATIADILTPAHALARRPAPVPGSKVSYRGFRFYIRTSGFINVGGTLISPSSAWDRVDEIHALAQRMAILAAAATIQHDRLTGRGGFTL